MNKKVLVSIIICICCFAAIAGETQKSSAYSFLYPAVFDNSPNILKQKHWIGKARVPGDIMRKLNVNPFGKGESMYVKPATAKRPVYWKQHIMLQGGRKYLLGAWVKNINAKALMWIFNGKKGKERFDIRLYYFSGMNTYLKPYLPNIQGGGQGWKIMYRIFTTPANNSKFRVTVHAGSYFSEGEVSFANVKLIDITDVKNMKLTACIKAPSPAKISSVKVFEQNTRDKTFYKAFETPVAEFKSEIPNTSFERGQNDKNVIEGYGMEVKFDNNTQKIFYAPEKGIIKRRT